MYGIGPGFSPSQQDRLAVARIEGAIKKGSNYQPGDILGLIRKGGIAEAVIALNKVWTSLPGNKQSRKKDKTGEDFTVDEVVARHAEFMKEMLKK
jgi:muramidase (phage lysozyme)